MADERDEIRSRIDILDLVNRQGVQLKRAGKHWKGLCPFHEDRNPSFYVSQDTGRYKCWSCGEAGDVFTWVMKTKNVDFVDALKILADQAGVNLASRGPVVPKSVKAAQQAAMEEALKFFQKQIGVSEIARSYCDNRSLDQAALKQWELGYAPDVGDALAGHLKKSGFSLAECKSLFLVDIGSDGGYYDKFRGRLMFPIRDERGDLVAFGGRLLGEGHPKYINSGDTPLYRKSKVLYGMWQAREQLSKKRRAVLVEGYLDVVACHRAGATNALASLGTALAEDHARLLRRWVDEVVILYDRDAAGQKAALRAVEILSQVDLRVKIALPPEGEDPDTLLKKEGPAAVERIIENSLPPLDFQILSLEKRLPPTDEQFWADAVAILATAPTEMELDKHLVRLAAKYPGVKDQLVAQNALRREVAKLRRPAKRGHKPPPIRVAAPSSLEFASLEPAELAIFGAFVEEGLRRRAWEAMASAELFSTDLGSKLATAIRDVFPQEPPAGKPTLWLSAVQPERFQQVLGDLLLDPRVQQITTPYLEDSINRLGIQQESRKLAESRPGDMDKESLLELNARLRKLKGDGA